MAHFHTVAETDVDTRGRVAIGKANRHGFQRYKVSVSDDGEILLTPVVSISARELAVLQDPALMKDIREGVTDLAAGRSEIIDFSAYADPNFGKDE